MKYLAKRGHKYRARVEVGFFKRAVVNESVVLDYLVNAGLDRVSVKKTGAGEYEVEGAWLHPDAEADLPDEVVADSIEDLGLAAA